MNLGYRTRCATCDTELPFHHNTCPDRNLTHPKLKMDQDEQIELLKAEIREHKFAMRVAVERVQEMKVALTTIYKAAHLEVESGWTAPVYRDILTTVANCAKSMLERTE